MISESIHILMHADDTTLLASDRSLAENKLRSLLIYCRNNKILLQMPKCEFVVINGKALFWIMETLKTSTK